MPPQPSHFIPVVTPQPPQPQSPGTHPAGPASFGSSPAFGSPLSGSRGDQGVGTHACWHGHPASAPSVPGGPGCRGNVPLATMPRRGHQLAGKSRQKRCHRQRWLGHACPPHKHATGVGQEAPRPRASPGGAGTESKEPGWQVLVCPAGTWSKVLMWLKQRPGLCPAAPRAAGPRPAVRVAPARGEGALWRCPGHIPCRRDHCRFHQPLPLTASVTPCRPSWTFPALASRLFPGCGCKVAPAVGGARLSIALACP